MPALLLRFEVSGNVKVPDFGSTVSRDMFYNICYCNMFFNNKFADEFV